MALVTGNVAINHTTGAETKSGASGSLYDAIAAIVPPTPLTAAELADPVKVLVFGRESQAAFTNAVAGWLVTQMTTNAVVLVAVSTSDSGLQRTPNPNNPNTDTLAPGVAKVLTGQVT